MIRCPGVSTRRYANSREVSIPSMISERGIRYSLRYLSPFMYMGEHGSAGFRIPHLNIMDNSFKTPEIDLG